MEKLSARDDVQLALVLERRGVITASQRRFALGAQASLAQRGRYVPLTAIFIHHGLATQAQIQEAIESPDPRPQPLGGTNFAGGRRFGRYRIERLLGEGAIGAVYLAYDMTLERKVAIKVLKALGNSSQRERFPLEARAAARLSHPNVIQIHEAGEEDGVPYIVMDAIDGVTLDVFTQREDRRAFLAALEQVARGVQHAHEQGVCHRDLKPENVLVDGSGRPVVTDFGLALFVNQTGSDGQRLTKTGQILGTPLYMAPEQFVGDLERTGPPTDVWALGVMLYEGVTGSPPFSGANFLELFTQVLTGALLQPSRVAPDVPRDMDTICEKALEKQPQARFANAGLLADELARHLRGEPLLTRPMGPARRLLRFMRRRRGLSLGAAASLIFASLAGASWLSRRADDSARPGQAQPTARLPNQVQASPKPDPGVDARAADEGGAASWSTVLEPNHLVVDKRARSIRDPRRPGSSGHALLTEAPEEPFVRILKGPRPALLFEVDLAPGKAKGRSEVRLRGADVSFCDTATDPRYYTQFEVFLPGEDESDLFDRKRTNLGDWNTIWQCPQLGAAPPHYYRVTSPPLSLQLYERRLFVRTYSDYAKYSVDLRDEDVYRAWRRTRGAGGQTPEFGETTRDEVRPAKVRRAPLRYAGYLKRDQWNHIFMEFRLGEQGSYRVWVNGELGAEFVGSIGYRTADDYAVPLPKVDVPGQGVRIKKRCSVRFGIYQGYGDPASPQNVTTHSQILVRRFALGTDERSVRSSGR